MVFALAWVHTEYRTMDSQGDLCATTLQGGLGLLIYLIPGCFSEKTTSQKIEMKGDPVNIKNITDSVKNEFDTVRKNMKL